MGSSQWLNAVLPALLELLMNSEQQTGFENSRHFQILSLNSLQTGSRRMRGVSCASARHPVWFCREGKHRVTDPLCCCAELPAHTDAPALLARPLYPRPPSATASWVTPGCSCLPRGRGRGRPPAPGISPLDAPEGTGPSRLQEPGKPKPPVKSLPVTNHNVKWKFFPLQLRICSGIPRLSASPQITGTQVLSRAKVWQIPRYQ